MKRYYDCLEDYAPTYEFVVDLIGRMRGCDVTNLAEGIEIARRGYDDEIGDTRIKSARRVTAQTLLDFVEAHK